MTLFNTDEKESKTCIILVDGSVSDDIFKMKKVNIVMQIDCNVRHVKREDIMGFLLMKCF